MILTYPEISLLQSMASETGRPPERGRRLFSDNYTLYPYKIGLLIHKYIDSECSYYKMVLLPLFGGLPIPNAMDWRSRFSRGTNVLGILMRVWVKFCGNCPLTDLS